MIDDNPYTLPRRIPPDPFHTALYRQAIRARLDSWRATETRFEVNRDRLYEARLEGETPLQPA